MELKELEMPTRTSNILKKKGIHTLEALTRIFPRKYYDFTKSVPLDSSCDGMVAIEGTFEEFSKKESNGKIIVKAKVKDKYTGNILHVSWFGQYFMYKIFQSSWHQGMECLVCGQVNFLEEYHCFCMGNPVVFSKNVEGSKKIHTVYTKMKGISEENMENLIQLSMTVHPPEETLDQDFLQKYQLLTYPEAVRILHNPESLSELDHAKKRLLFDDLLYFACKMEEERRILPNGSAYGIRTLKNTNQLLNSLPYQLTKDQKETYDTIINKIKDGKRINALIQGDVGCGKTIVSILLMFAMADSGFQSLLMAPTTVLATQHYKELTEYAKQAGYKVAFLGGKQKTSEKKKLLEEIKNGTYQFIVGTHSVISKDVEFNNLGMAIVDEEHKFGVAQRDIILEKAGFGVHTIHMSATPIPRSLASTLYADNVDVFNIMSMPKGRLPVKTTIFSKEHGIFKFLEKEIALGHQAYVVCPLIEEADEDGIMAGIESVDETALKYDQYFSPKGIKCCTVTGKMTEEEVKNNINEFAENKYQILIATTVIEVGVNVPNTTVIVINNAERFGLAGLHQLRGRVGRSDIQSYCILNSKETENERLTTMCETNNGFEIAEADMKLRGTGNLIGLEQSGINQFIEELTEYPKLYGVIKGFANEFSDSGKSEEIIKNFEKY